MRADLQLGFERLDDRDLAVSGLAFAAWTIGLGAAQSAASSARHAPAVET